MNIEIAENSRVFIAGQTGSGKTYLAEKLLESANRLIVFDVKNNLADRLHLQKATMQLWRKFLRGKDLRLQVLAPIISSELLEEFYDEQFRRVFNSADCRCYFDELYDVTLGSNSIPPYFRALFTRGREPVVRDNRIVAGNIGVFSCSQRPSRIPLFVMTEAQHFFVFRLLDPDDRIRMSEYVGKEVREPIPDEHGFWYRDVLTMNAPVYVESI